jgi:hypothetical protein
MTQRSHGSVPAILLIVLAATGLALGGMLALHLGGPSADASGRMELIDVRLQTNPSGASVLVDGRFAGTSPVTLRNVAAGEHLLHVERDGYQPLVRRITLGDQPQVRLSLRPSPQGTLRLRSRPSGADVFVNGEHQGTTPRDLERLPAGDYHVVVRKDNYEDYAVTARVVADRSTLVDPPLVDRIEKWYLAAIAAEPDNIRHCTDLAHWYFIQERMEESVHWYAQGLKMIKQGRGDPDDRKRHEKEIRKHLGWMRGNREKLEHFRSMLRRAQQKHL